MLKKKLYLTLFIFTFSTSAFSKEQAGFNEICHIYTEVQNSNMTNTQLNDYIHNNIEQRVKSVDALQTHSAVFQVDPTERYSIFKKSAEFSLKQAWSCSAMKILMK